MRIFIGGMAVKKEIENIVRENIPNAKITIGSDLDGAIALQTQTHDYYLGACNTGGGGALAMAISLLGISKTLIIAGVIGKKSKTEVKTALKNGVVAFGMQLSNYEYGVKTFIEALKIND